MPLYLCLDAGNTRLKATLFEDTQLQKPVDTADFAPGDAAGVEALANRHGPAAAIVCAVTGTGDALEAAVRSRIAKTLRLLPSTPTPIINAYRSADTLGPDRLALAVAVQDRFPGEPVLAIAAGTCITYNFVAPNRAFRGGAISPGVSMRLQAMHRFTDRLPEVPLDGDALLLGYDTESCMRSGAVLGAAAEIDGMVAAYGAQYPGIKAILTGGDAARLQPHLKSGIFADPHLLAQGLARILRHNAPYLR